MDKIPAADGIPFPAIPTPTGDDRPDEQYDMRIARDGTWFYHGSPIGRIALVKLFATVLKRDDAGDFWLITPAERGRITVEDAPFVAVELRPEGEGGARTLSLRTNLDEWVTAGADHPIRVAYGDPAGAELSEAPAPYILVRDRLEARIGRAVFYELVGLAEERQTPTGIELGVWSGRIFFPLGLLPRSEPAGGVIAAASVYGLTKGDIRRLFLKRVAGADRGGGASRGDHELNPGMVPLSELRAAAVLVPLVDRPAGFSVLLTRRTAHLSRHAGQIAFPGGQVDDGDADAVATALRETEEEIGLSRDHVEPVGRLDRYVTRTGFTVTPVVALVQPPFTLSVDTNEVEEAFEVPLAFIVDPANRKKDSHEFQGVLRYFYAFRHGERNIWGATAGMLVNLADILTG